MTNVKGIVSINGEVIGEFQDLTLVCKVQEEPADLHSTYQRYTRGPTYTKGHIGGGHFEKGRWVSVVSDLIDFIIPKPDNSPILITTTLYQDIFEGWRHVRTETQDLDLGAFTVEKHGDIMKLKRIEEK
jgi:hypothetical protein